MSSSHAKTALRNDDSLPDGTPIETHLKAMADDRRLPVQAVRQCVIRFEESAPALRAVLTKAAEGEVMTEGEMNLFFRGLYVLAEARDQLAFQALLRLLHRPIDDVDELLGDATTASLPHITISTFDGDIDGLLNAITDLSIEDFTRASLLGAATFLTWEKRIPLDRMQEFLTRYDEEKLAPNGDYIWNAWADAIALLNLQSLVPRVEKAQSDARFFDEIIEYDYFQKELARAEREPDNVERFREARLGYIEDAVEEQLWADHDDPPPRPDTFSKARLLAQMAAEAPWLAEPARPRVGRNDPCPCGSGKKYKKCCLVD